jgi:hypothetical protein
VTLTAAAAAVASAVAAAAPAPAATAGAGAQRPVVSLSASPSRVELAGRSAVTVALRNVGTAPVVVEAAPEGLVVDVRGRPRIGGARSVRPSAAAWITVRPRRVSLRAGGSARLELRSRPPRRAEPGDHHAALLLSTLPVQRGRVGVRMRLGVRVVVRVPGRIVRRLAVRGVRVRRARGGRYLDVALANLGNVTERLDRGRVAVTLLARGRVLARLRTAPRELLPRTRGLAIARYAGRRRGLVVARVEVRGAGRRAFRIRL